MYFTFSIFVLNLTIYFRSAPLFVFMKYNSGRYSSGHVRGIPNTTFLFHTIKVFILCLDPPIRFYSRNGKMPTTGTCNSYNFDKICFFYIYKPHVSCLLHAYLLFLKNHKFYIYVSDSRFTPLFVFMKLWL